MIYVVIVVIIDSTEIKKHDWLYSIVKYGTYHYYIVPDCYHPISVYLPNQSPTGLTPSGKYFSISFSHQKVIPYSFVASFINLVNYNTLLSSILSLFSVFKDRRD